MVDGEPYFVARDVARVLGYAKPENAIAMHCKATLKRGIPSFGGTQETTLIPERDIYRLVMKSKLPAAEKFEEWIVSEVLPSIRKTGSYGAADPMAVLNDPAAMRGLLLTYTEKVLTLESTVAQQAPKVAALDRISESQGSMCLTDAAKALKIQPRELNAWLSAKRWIYKRAGGKNWIAYQDRLQSGLLEHKATSVDHSDGTSRLFEQVRVTAKGLARLAEKFVLARQELLPL